MLKELINLATLDTRLLLSPFIEAFLPDNSVSLNLKKEVTLARKEFRAEAEAEFFGELQYWLKQRGETKEKHYI